MNIIRARLDGHLTVESVRQALAEIGREFTRAKSCILIDMTGVNVFEMDTKPVIIKWINRRQKRIEKIAVITMHIAWDVLISAIQSEVKVRTIAFNSEAEAAKWISTPSPGSGSRYGG